MDNSVKAKALAKNPYHWQAAEAIVLQSLPTLARMPFLVIQGPAVSCWPSLAPQFEERQKEISRVIGETGILHVKGDAAWGQIERNGIHFKVGEEQSQKVYTSLRAVQYFATMVRHLEVMALIQMAMDNKYGVRPEDQDPTPT